MDKFEFDGIICERFVLGPLEVNSYLVYDPATPEGIIIDPADGSRELIDRIIEKKWQKNVIFLTHGHADHILGVDRVKAAVNASVLCSVEDAPMLTSSVLNLSEMLGFGFTVSPADVLLKDGDTLSLGKHTARILGIPGHTPGGIALCFQQMVFSGDTLFAGSIGRSDFPRGDGKLLIETIRSKLLTLPDMTVFPGHGPETTISRERKTNPWLEHALFS